MSVEALISTQVIDTTSVGRSIMTAADAAAVRTAADAQVTLVSGTNIKTINSTSLLGSGDIAVSASPGGSTTQLQYNDAGSFGGTAAVVYETTVKHVTMTAQGATIVPLVVKGAASQSGNLTEWQNSAGTVGLYVSPANGGQILSGCNTLYRSSFGAANFAAIGYFGSSEFQFYPYSNTSWGFASGTSYTLTSYRSVYLSTNASGLHGVHIPATNNPQAAWDVHAAVDSVILRVKLLSGQTANSVVIVNSADAVQFAFAANGRDMILDATTGTKIGTATTQKLGFWSATPVVQQVLATGASRTVDEVITMLQTLGLCKQA